eukprot:gene4753-5210_t
MSDSEDEVEYELEDFQLGEYKISVTTVAYLPITILLANQTKNVEISGQKLWCGSLCLVNHLFTHPTLVQNAIVIELGAGTGVVSMIAEKRGSVLTIATDHDQRSLDHMKSDFQLNQTKVLVERLDWYNPVLTSILSQIEESQSTSQVFLIAGDVLYKHALLEPFFQTVLMILTHFPQGRLILCHVPRAGVEQSQVVEAARSVGLIVEEELAPATVMDSQLASYCPEEDLVRARLYTIHKA